MTASISIRGDGFDALQLLLERFAENVSNPQPMFNAMADQFALSQRQNLGSGGGYYGYFQPLVPGYAAWKDAAYPGAPILTRTGELRESLTSRPFGVEHIDDRRMVLGTQIEYARYHQEGTSRMPKRPLINEPTQSEMRQYGSILHRFAFEGVAA